MSYHLHVDPDTDRTIKSLDENCAICQVEGEDAADATAAGYRIVPDGAGFTVLAPPLGSCVWQYVPHLRLHRPPLSREVVGEEYRDVAAAWRCAVEDLELVRDRAEWEDAVLA